jgi:hypothetical protein
VVLFMHLVDAVHDNQLGRTKSLASGVVIDEHRYTLPLPVSARRNLIGVGRSLDRSDQPRRTSRVVEGKGAPLRSLRRYGTCWLAGR